MSRRRQKSQITDLDDNFSYPSKLLTSASPVLSPTKMTRTVSSTVPKKRRLKNTKTNLESDEDMTTWSETGNIVPEIGNPLELSVFDKYFDAVLSNCAGFVRISRDTFVVQGWDAKKEQSTVGKLY
jgi:hypothetical protein